MIIHAQPCSEYIKDRFRIFFIEYSKTSYFWRNLLFKVLWTMLTILSLSKEDSQVKIGGINFIEFTTDVLSGLLSSGKSRGEEGFRFNEPLPSYEVGLLEFLTSILINLPKLIPCILSEIPGVLSLITLKEIKHASTEKKRLLKEKLHSIWRIISSRLPNYIPESKEEESKMKIEQFIKKLELEFHHKIQRNPDEEQVLKDIEFLNENRTVETESYVQDSKKFYTTFQEYESLFKEETKVVEVIEIKSQESSPSLTQNIKKNKNELKVKSQKGKRPPNYMREERITRSMTDGRVTRSKSNKRKKYN